MSVASKLSVGLLAAACIGMLSAQEIFSVAEPADFIQAKKVFKADDALAVKGNSYLFSTKSPWYPHGTTSLPCQKNERSGYPGNVSFHMTRGFSSSVTSTIATFLSIREVSATRLPPSHDG